MCAGLGCTNVCRELPPWKASVETTTWLGLVTILTEFTGICLYAELGLRACEVVSESLAGLLGVETSVGLMTRRVATGEPHGDIMTIGEPPVRFGVDVSAAVLHGGG